jgi:hypothetical protein
MKRIMETFSLYSGNLLLYFISLFKILYNRRASLESFQTALYFPGECLVTVIILNLGKYLELRVPDSIFLRVLSAFTPAP